MRIKIIIIFSILLLISCITLIFSSYQRKQKECNSVIYFSNNSLKSISCSNILTLKDSTGNFSTEIITFKNDYIILNESDPGVPNFIEVSQDELQNIIGNFYTFKDGGWEVAQKPAESNVPSYLSLQEKIIQNSYLKSSSPRPGQVYSVYQKTEGGYTTELDFGNNKKLSINYECRIDLVCWPLFKNDFFELVKSIEVK